MIQFIIQFHSGLRYLILALLCFVIINGLRSLIFKSPFLAKDKVLALSVLVITHLQMMIGFFLYFVSEKVVFSELTMKVKIFRFFTVEHSCMMLLAVVLITVGFSRAKKAKLGSKHKIIVIYYSIALVLILAAIPWALLG